MAYNQIQISEVTNGAALDQTTLSKVKYNFDDIKSNLDANIAEVQDMRSQDAWTPLALQANWVMYPAGWITPQYYKDEMNRVWLKSILRKNAGTNYLIATLPVGYRPGSNEIFCVIGAGAIMRVDIDTGGSITCTPGSGAIDYISLSGISFLAEN
jgi:hypothetical protein